MIVCHKTTFQKQTFISSWPCARYHLDGLQVLAHVILIQLDEVGSVITDGLTKLGIIN